MGRNFTADERLAIRARVLSAALELIAYDLRPTVARLREILPDVPRGTLGWIRAELRREGLIDWADCDVITDGRLTGATEAERAEIARATAEIRAEKRARGEYRFPRELRGQPRFLPTVYRNPMPEIRHAR